MDVERAVERRQAMEQRVERGHPAMEQVGFTRTCDKVKGHGEYIDSGVGCPICYGHQRPYRPMRFAHYQQEIDAALRERPPSGPVDESS